MLKKKGKRTNLTSHDSNQFPTDRKADERESRLQITKWLTTKAGFHLCLKTATIK